jgi:hypothetical protein
MKTRLERANPGSARVSRAGFGVPPKQSFDQASNRVVWRVSKSPRKRDACTSMRDACATQIMQ